MHESLEQLFPCQDFPQIKNILYLGLEIALTYEHACYTIEHIVYGYMKFIELPNSPKNNVYQTFPWYTDSNNYLSISGLKSKPNISKKQTPGKDNLVISDDVKQLSKKYKQYIADMNMETFYYLMLYTNIHSFGSRCLIPTGSCNILDSLTNILFDIFLKTPNSHVYLTENRAQTNSKQSNNKSSNKKNIVPHDTKNCTSEIIYKNFLIQPATTISTDFVTPLKLERTTDITYLASKGKYPKIVGREHELNRLIDILSKKIKNNAVLIGNPGVGKTAIVHALAQSIVSGKVPNVLAQYHILELDLTAVIAGTKYRGEFEKRIHELISQLNKSTQKIILYIDEMHSSINLGGTADSDALSFTDMLKPVLLNSNIKIIGTSTFKDYKQLEADKALERRFDTITVNQPSFNQTLEILNSIKIEFERYYHVDIPTSTLETAISLSQRYIPERFLPDKAIDVLDESCAIKVNSYPSKTVVSPSDVFVCISRKKEIPLNKVQKAYTLENLEQHLSSKVVGQQHVITIVAQAIRRAQAGLNDENKPLASFLFIGPTGVGKTEIAKTLADIMFDNSENFIRFDMSEYMEEHSVSKLIGSPPGYVGYEDAGLLTEQVRRHPYSLILFDEFEKAHPRVWNILLQILDEGSLTDSHGDHINFKNTVVILTSNVGVGELSKKSVGFGENNTSKSKDILAEVKRKFSPEFLNRLDEIVQFNQLSKEDILSITKICISTDIMPKLKSKNINIDISDDVIEKIAKLGYNQEYGARELKRTVMRELKNPLADFLLQNNEVCNISVNLANGEIAITSKDIPILI